MKIIIEPNKNERQSPEVVLDLKTCHYPYAIREAIQLALKLDGYDEGTIREVFGQMPEMKCEPDPSLIEILEANAYRDGGTVCVRTEEEVFCFDGRIKSKTLGRLYRNYPGKPESSLIEDSQELEEILLKSLASFSPPYGSENVARIHELKARAKKLGQDYVIWDDLNEE